MCSVYIFIIFIHILIQVKFVLLIMQFSDITYKTHTHYKYIYLYFIIIFYNIISKLMYIISRQHVCLELIHLLAWMLTHFTIFAAETNFTRTCKSMRRSCTNSIVLARHGITTILIDVIYK